MKKTILTTIVALFVFTMGANAQGIGIGIKGGLNLAKLDGIENAENRTGLHAGAYVNLNLGGISIQPELLYSAQGAE